MRKLTAIKCGRLESSSMSDLNDLLNYIEKVIYAGKKLSKARS